VRAAEDHGVDARGAQRCDVAAHRVDHPLVEREAALDDGRQVRARNRGEEGGFDSVDAEPGDGKPPTEAVFWPPGEGERLEANNRVATIKIGREELTLIEFEIWAGFEGPDPHAHDDHVDSFYVLEGEVDFLAGDEWLRLPAGSFVAAPIGVTHGFANRDGQRARLLNIHAPSTGFHDRLREMS